MLQRCEPALLPLSESVKGSYIAARGQKFSSSCSHCRLFHRRSWLHSSVAVISREAQSAGSWSVGTWFHGTSGIRVWMFATRFATKVGHSNGCCLSHARTTIESVHACVEHSVNFIVSCTNAISFANNVATHSSNLGTLTVLIGATLDFAISKFTWTLLSASSTRRYRTAAYARMGAFANPWICHLVEVELGWIQRESNNARNSGRLR